ncbi:MAG: hypothetical protein E7515_07615 [Ruminococcaceae bacterium]|nr:hypothetical protein [Oscillospiraceae bacterium]
MRVFPLACRKAHFTSFTCPSLTADDDGSLSDSQKLLLFAVALIIDFDIFYSIFVSLSTSYALFY